MGVAWKWMLQRSAYGWSAAFCARAGSQADRTPAIGKMSGRFTRISVSSRQSSAINPLSLLGEQACQDQDVVQHKEHHHHQVRAETEQGNTHARRHRHRAKTFGIDLLFRYIV